jgi:uncharacterized membrane protein YagU involved in acid resistance
MAHDGNRIAAASDGAIAGAVATWAMWKLTTYLYAREDQSAREREDRARRGTTAYGALAEKSAKAVGATLSEEQRDAYGSRIHWALGAGAGALFGLLRNSMPAAGAGYGLAFGTAFWLLVDEGVVYLLGLTPGPAAFPWQTHARGLAGHLVYGVVANTALAALEPAS